MISSFSWADEALKITYLLRHRCPKNTKPCPQYCDNMPSTMVGTMESFDLKLERAIREGNLFVIGEDSISLRGKVFQIEKIKKVKYPLSDKKWSQANLGFRLKFHRNDRRRDRLLVSLQSEVHAIKEGRFSLLPSKIKRRDPRVFDTVRSLIVGNILCFPKKYKPRAFYMQMFPNAPLPDSKDIKNYELLIRAGVGKN